MFNDRVAAQFMCNDVTLRNREDAEALSNCRILRKRRRSINPVWPGLRRGTLHANLWLRVS